jgi:hypothetical protein
MRLHINDRDGTDALKAELTLYAFILLDGVKQDGCIWADEEAGELECYIRQDDPRYKAEAIKQGPDKGPTEIKKGVVRIKDTRDEYRPV